LKCKILKNIKKKRASIEHLNQRHGTLEGLCHFFKKNATRHYPPFFFPFIFYRRRTEGGVCGDKKSRKKKTKK
jgi:hypothetical protein